MSNMLLFSGTANPALAKRVAESLGLALGEVMVSKFQDGEIRVQYLESIYNKDIILIQPTNFPQDTNLMELFLLADAAFRGSARSVTAIVPYMGYSRQDRCIRTKQEPIAAKLVAKMLKLSGIERFVTISLHSDQIQGFFEMPVYNLCGNPLFVEEALLRQKNLGTASLVVVAPDAGGITRARSFAEKLNNADLIFINKKRLDVNLVKALDVIGDVKNKDCILIDDIVDTAGTLIAAADALKASGANRVIAYCVHPVLSGSAVDKINDSVLDELIVTDTIPLSNQARECKKIKQFSVAPMIAEAILQIEKKKI